MRIVNWLKSRLSSRGKALYIYRRGMLRAKQHDPQGAIDDYTATIDGPETPPDVKAMALFNRALVRCAADEHNPQVIDDLTMVLAMPESLADVKTEARRKLERMKRHSSKTNK